MVKSLIAVACLLPLGLVARASGEDAAAAGSGRPTGVVLGYSAAWRDEAAPPAGYNFGGLTYLARAFLRPTPDGDLKVPDGYFNPAFAASAHAHGVKVLLSVGGGSAGAAGWMSIANNPAHLARFLDTLDQMMRDHQFDGVDVDWEPVPSTDAEGAAYTTVLKAVRARFPHAVVTTAVDTNEYAVKFFSWPDVIASVDYVNAMAYDYAGSWGGVAGLATNLYPTGAYTPLPEHSVDEGMRNLLHHGVPPGKLLLGFNFWAYRFRADHLGDAFPKNAEGYSDDLSYQQVLDLIGTGHYRPLWDAAAAAPYLERVGGGTVVTYDNPESVRRKCEYAKGLNLAGVMIWTVGGDASGTQAPLMDAVAQSFGGKAEQLPRPTLEAEVAEVTGSLTAGGEKPAAGPSASMTSSQLEAAYARAHQQWGAMADQRWQAHDPRAAKK